MENDISAFSSESHEDTNLKEHFHNSHEIVFIKEGCANFIIENKEYKADKNSLIFINNFEHHEVIVLDFPYIRYFVLINPRHFQRGYDPVLKSIFTQRPDDYLHTVKLKGDHAAFLEQILNNMQREQLEENEYTQKALNSYLTLFFISLRRHHPHLFPLVNTGKAALISEIQSYIENHFTEDITLETLSRSYYVNRYYLSHLFKKYAGYNFKQYLLLQRFSRARELLRDTDLNITEIASHSGFNNINHFIRIFREFEGISPNKYRKSLRVKFPKC